MNVVWNEPLLWCCAEQASGYNVSFRAARVVLGCCQLSSGISLQVAHFSSLPRGASSFGTRFLELALGNFDDFLPFVLDIMSLSGTEPGRSLREPKLKVCMWTMRIGSSFIDYRSLCICFCFSQRTSSLDNAAADPVALSKPWNPRYHNFVFYTVHVIGHMY